MSFESLESRALVNGNSLDGQWIKENEVREYDLLYNYSNHSDEPKKDDKTFENDLSDILDEPDEDEIIEDIASEILDEPDEDEIIEDIASEILDEPDEDEIIEDIASDIFDEPDEDEIIEDIASEILDNPDDDETLFKISNLEYLKAEREKLLSVLEKRRVLSEQKTRESGFYENGNENSHRRGR